MPGAFRIFRNFDELLDVKISRVANSYFRLNTDGTVTEQTAAELLAELGVAGDIVAEAVEAEVDLLGGDAVNMFDDLGTLKIRKANAATGLRAHGFIENATLAGSTADVISHGDKGGFSSLTQGRVYYLYTAGTISLVPPSTGLVQQVATARSGTEVRFHIQAPEAYQHVQSIANASWSITHNLGRFPTVTVKSGGDIVVPSITYTDEFSLTLDFINQTAGSAYLT